MVLLFFVRGEGKSNGIRGRWFLVYRVLSMGIWGFYVGFYTGYFEIVLFCLGFYFYILIFFMFLRMLGFNGVFFFYSFNISYEFDLEICL